MQVVSDTFLIASDPELLHTTKVKSHTGEYIIVEADVNKYDYANQLGTIEHVPATLSPKYANDTPLYPQDLVIVHYHVIHPKYAVHLDNKELFKCPYFQIWCKIENEKIIPLEDYLFVEPIIEDQELSTSSLFCKQFQDTEYKKRTGRVFAVGKQALAAGIMEGDTVFITQHADLEVDILGKKLWRMRIRNVIGLERDSILQCLNGKAIVKQLPDDEAPQSVFAVEADPNKKEHKGIVLQSNIAALHPQDIISYWNGTATEIEYKGEKYAYIDETNINYVI